MVSGKVNRLIVMRFALPLLLVVVLTAPLFASKYAGEFMSIGSGAAPLGMGSAGVSIPVGPESAWWNPALLSMLDGSRVTAMHSERFSGLVGFDTFAFSRKIKDSDPGNRPMVLGFQLQATSVTDIPVTDLIVDSLPPVLDDGTINFTDEGMIDSRYFVLYSTLATLHSFLDTGLGVTLKLIHRNVMGFTAWGAGLDLGAVRSWNNGVIMGVALSDIATTPVLWETGRTEIVTPTLRTGMSWSKGAEDDLLKGRCAAEMEIKFDDLGDAADLSLGFLSADFHLGGELWINDTMAMRCGLDRGNRFSAGAAVEIGIIKFDYAFMMDDELGNTHRVSMTLNME